MKTIVVILSLFLFSCQSIRFASRKEKDLNLSESNNALNNTFHNNLIDSIPYTPSSIWQRLSNKEYKAEYLLNTEVKFAIVDKNHIKVQLLSGDELLEEKILKGKFKKGYFALKNRFNAEFKAGPLLWAFAGFKMYLGITKENNLILFETNAGSTVILILPIFWAGSVNHIEYKPTWGKYGIQLNCVKTNHKSTFNYKSSFSSREPVSHFPNCTSLKR